MTGFTAPCREFFDRVISSDDDEDQSMAMFLRPSLTSSAVKIVSPSKVDDTKTSPKPSPSKKGPLTLLNASPPALTHPPARSAPEAMQEHPYLRVSFFPLSRLPEPAHRAHTGPASSRTRGASTTTLRYAQSYHLTNLFFTNNATDSRNRSNRCKLTCAFGGPAFLTTPLSLETRNRAVFRHSPRRARKRHPAYPPSPSTPPCSYPNPRRRSCRLPPPPSNPLEVPCRRAISLPLRVQAPMADGPILPSTTRARTLSIRFQTTSMEMDMRTERTPSRQISKP
jgi:hypothetical protein